MVRFAPWVTLLLMAAPFAAPAAAQEPLQHVKLPHADEAARWITEDFILGHTRYLSSDLLEGWDLSGQVEDARLLFQVGYAVAQAATAPAWNPGDEFAAARAACGTP